MIKEMDKDNINDADIRSFFHANRPMTSDPDAFDLEFAARCRALAGIREYHAREMRRCRRISILTLTAGIILGVAVTLLLIFKPQTVLSSGTGILALTTALLAGGGRQLALLAIAAAAMLYGLRGTLAER